MHDKQFKVEQINSLCQSPAGFNLQIFNNNNEIPIKRKPPIYTRAWHAEQKNKAKQKSA